MRPGVFAGINPRNFDLKDRIVLASMRPGVFAGINSPSPPEMPAGPLRLQ